MFRKYYLIVILFILIFQANTIYGKKKKIIERYRIRAEFTKAEREPQIDGETKLTATSFSDDLIVIVFSPSRKQIGFRILNATKYSMSIVWDECVFVDHKNNASKIMHAGIRYVSRNDPMSPTIIPSGVKVSDMIVPTDNIYYMQWKGKGWQTRDIFNGEFFKEKVLKECGWNPISFRVILVLEKEKNKFIYNFYFTTKLFKFSRTKKRGDWESITEVK